jgi:hypothetical protein
MTKQILEEGDRLQLSYQGRLLGTFTVVSGFFETALVHRDSDSFQIYIPREFTDNYAEDFHIVYFPKRKIA